MIDSETLGTRSGTSAAQATRRPLQGLRVIDLTVALAGPYCTMMLGALGAEVIRIDARTGGDIGRINPPFFGPNGFHFGKMGEGDLSISTLLRARNKKSITLDLKSGRGRELFAELVRKSDVLVENMSEGTVDRLGVGYAAMKAVNPRLVYTSIFGLGGKYPYEGLKAMDIIIQALAGVMAVTGEPDGAPTRVGLPIADLFAANMALTGILSAIIQRGTTGEGQHVEVSMLECMSSLLAIENFDVFEWQGFPPRTGNHLNRLAPFGLYATKDGHVAIAAAADKWVWSLFEAMGQPGLRDDPRFNGRGPRAANALELTRLVEEWTGNLTSDAVVQALFTERGIPCARLRSAAEVLADPALRASGIIQPLVHPQLGATGALGPGVPIGFSGAEAALDIPAEALGESNAAVYGDLLGLSAEELSALIEQGVI